MYIRSKFQGDTCEISHSKEFSSCSQTVMSSCFVKALDNSAIVPNN